MQIYLFISFITIGLARSHQLCPPPGTGVQSVAIPGSCQRFLQCLNGNGVLRECMVGLHFDVVRGVCNTIEAANCNPCANNLDDEVTFIRDPTNCARFAHCIGPSYHFEEICPEGYNFDVTLNVCAPSENVDCSDSQTTTGFPVITITTTTACPSIRVQPIAFPGFSDRYILCGNPIMQQCSPGLSFNAVLGECHAQANYFEKIKH